MPTLPKMDVPEPVGTDRSLSTDAGHDDDGDSPALSARAPATSARSAR